ncbi:5415_t:CDS:1 [Acaulospora colombiana]|uniref:5415_t:CDS:1 n=1 Tax=Acaulospora colombiana TaxID=27376 RepID=A0ACA9PKY2_9GLOM|nr:5415_t:CDS:1 [Acaulospora colombiana]
MDLNGKYRANITADEELRIAGAFKDGEQVVVEPLSYDLLYPDSLESGRIIQLAQHLFALYSCLKTVENEIMKYCIFNPSCHILIFLLSSPKPPSTNEPGCPRVFGKILNSETNQTGQLEFKKLRKEHWQVAGQTINYLNLIFDATLDGINVLAKVLLRPYGNDVHVHLAAQNMAPQLYGTSIVHGVARVAVMQLLEDGWITLFDYRHNWHRNGIQEEPKIRLLKRLEEILECLESGGMVHGDFRMANIMLKIGEEEKAVLIDFDWAGEAGKVKYPVTRSDDLGYPGEPGGPISAGDDRQYFETWRNELNSTVDPQ